MRRLTLGLLLLLSSTAAAQQLDLGGQVRPRFEVRHPTPGPSGEQTLEFTSMRTRLSLEARLHSSVRAFVQLQDVRVWGSETGTTDPSADAMDLHQGWLELGREEDLFAVRVGRQELAYGGQRLVGAVNWAQQARAFDGIRIRVRPSARATMDAFAAQIGDIHGGRPDQSLLGLYGTLDAAGSVDLFLLYHTQDLFVTSGPTAETRTEQLSKTATVGARWASASGGLQWRVEAAYQLGEDQQAGAVTDVAAFMLGARVGAQATESLAVTLWYDYLSGDDDPSDSERRVFDTLFATNHKFYGYMDLFVNFPSHTQGRGLQDLALKTTLDLAPGHSLSGDLHSFRYAATAGLDSGHVGEELDLTYRWGYGPGVTLTAGASYFRAGDAAPVPAAPAADDGMVWGYLMADVVF